MAGRMSGGGRAWSGGPGRPAGLPSPSSSGDTVSPEVTPRPSAAAGGGEAHWLGAGETRGGARVHALLRLEREVRIGRAEGEEVLPLLCLRNGHDGGLAVTVSVAPFRLACLNGMMLPLAGTIMVFVLVLLIWLESKIGG